MADVRRPRPPVRPEPTFEPEPIPRVDPTDEAIVEVTGDVARSVKSLEKAVEDAVPLFVNVVNSMSQPVNLMTRSARILLNPHEVTRISAEIWEEWQREMEGSPLKQFVVESK